MMNLLDAMIHNERHHVTNGAKMKKRPSRSKSGRRLLNTNSFSVLRDIYQESPDSIDNPKSPSKKNIEDQHGTTNIKYVELDLYEAAKESDAEGFNNVLRRVSKKNGRTELDILKDTVSQSRDTLLHTAVSHGNTSTVETIGEKCPQLLRMKNFKGDTVWHIAAKTENLEMFQVLLKLFECFNSQLSYSNNKQTRIDVTWEDLSLREINEKGNTPLHEALMHRCKQMADELVKNDRDRRIPYPPNEENKSAMYLAAEAGYIDTLEKMLKDAKVKYETLEGKSLAHAAIMGKQKDALEYLLKKDSWFKESKEGGKNPLHWAASIGFLDGVRYLSGKYSFMATERDKNGSLPIHCAAMNGHVDVIQYLLQLKQYSNNRVNRDGQNVLHVAAKSGRHNVVRYILNTLEPKSPANETDKKGSTAPKSLINEIDKKGNTPLHLASKQSNFKIVSTLTRDKRVDLNVTNFKGLTPLDAVEHYMKGITSFRQWLTWNALKAAGAHRAPSGKDINARSRRAYKRSRPSSTAANNKSTIRALLLVSILIAMISFESASTKLACYNNSETDPGLTTELRRVKFILFVFCHAVAMSSSIVIAGTLILAKLGDDNAVFAALRMAKPLLGMALTMLILALMPEVYPVVSKLHWIVDAALTTAMAFLVSLVTLFFPLCFSFPFGYSIVRHITYFPMYLMISYSGDNLED